MYKYKLSIAYNGSFFSGWQRQTQYKNNNFVKEINSIQKIIKNIISKILKTNIKLISASRTDKGVHAYEQIAVFCIDILLPLNDFLKKINKLMPYDIHINSITKVENNFHPRFLAKAKAYLYRICYEKDKNPFIFPYTWVLKYQIDWDKFIFESKKLIGKHDFISFCASDSNCRNYVRNIFEIEIILNNTIFEIWIIADGFLKHMIRNIIGTLIDIARDKLNICIYDLIKLKDRRYGGICAPAKGLTLVKIFYDKILRVENLKKHIIYMV